MSCQPARVCLFLLSVCLLLPSGTSAKKKPPIHPVNLNTASSAELQQVPGIGPSTAGKILQMRKSYGTFKSVDDLLAIRGIGAKRLEKMRKYLSVGKPVQAKKTGSGAQSASAGAGAKNGSPKNPAGKTTAPPKAQPAVQSPGQPAVSETEEP
jgi:competence ComEA-like helix-hairpin-helix protein